MRLSTAAHYARLAAVVLLLPAAAIAQGGRVAGKVVDEAGKPLAGVEAKIVETETGAEFSTQTNKKGRFSLAVVHPDRDYEIVLSKEGFAPVREAIQLKRGDPVQGSWTMKPPTDGMLLGLDLSPEELEAKKAAVAFYNEGAQAFNAGDLELAVARFDAAITEDSELAEAYPIAATLNFQLENYERALELAEVVIGLETDESTRAMGIRYDALDALGRAAEADAALDALIAAVPDIDTARRTYNRGLSHAKGGDLDTAIPRLEQAILLEPTLAPAWGLLGDLEIARGNHQRAIEAGDQLLTIDGSRERGLSLRHRAFEAMGDETAAAEALRALAAETPDAVMNSLFERGNDLFDSNDPLAAAKVYRQVLDLQPDNAEAHYKLGLSLLSAEDTSTAVTHLKRFLELAPEHPEAAAARDMLTYVD